MTGVAGLPLKCAMTILPLNGFISASALSIVLVTRIPTLQLEALFEIQADDVMRVHLSSFLV